MATQRTPPSLPEIVFDDKGFNIPSALINSDRIDPSPTGRPRIGSSSNSGAAPPLAYKTPFDQQDQEVNEPLLTPPNKTQVRLKPAYLTLKRQDSTNRVLIITDQNHGAQLNSEQPLHRRHSYIQSDVAHCYMTPSSSPASEFFDTPPVTPSKFFHFRKPGKHPFAHGYEVPRWRLLTVHLVVCGLVYPFLLVFVIASRGANLFWARVFVGVGCGVAGVLLGFSLMNLAKAIMEAAGKFCILNVPG